MANVKVRVRKTHNYGFHPAGTVLHVDESEARRVPDVLELVEHVESLPAPEPAAELEQKEVEMIVDESEAVEATEHHSEVVPSSGEEVEEGAKKKRRR